MDLIILIVAVTANLLLGLFVLLRNNKSATNILFFLFNIDIALWSLANYYSLIPTEPSEKLFWMRLVMFLAIPQSIFFFLLIHTLPSNKIKLKKSILVVLIFLGILTMYISMSPYLFTSVEVKNGVVTPIAGPGMILFMVVALGTVVVGFITLLRKLYKANGIEKIQLKYILIGVLSIFLFIIIFNFVLVVFFENLNFIALSPLYTFPLVISIAYTIIKHRFFDIRLIVARALAYVLLIIFISLGYIAFLFDVAIILHPSASNRQEIQDLILPALLAVLFAISFQPLRRFFERITDKFFYKDHYDANTMLWDLSRIMASTLKLSELSKKIIDKLLGDMKISYGEVVLIRNSSIIWVGGSGRKSEQPFKGTDIAYLIKEAHSKKTGAEQILIYEEIPTESKLKYTMREHNITLVLPLVVKDELIGGILLGEKSSGEIYSSEDIDVLKIIAPEIAVAVKNALSFEEIKRFNITLEEEVKHATERLRKANHRLKELDNLKDEFVSIASHELRTPMTAIKSYLWMALNQPGQDIKEPLKKYLNISYNSTERLIRLVNDMLTVSRIERNKIELKTADVDVYVIAKAVYDELKITADERKIHLTIHRAEGTPYMVNGDREKLREVFQNIVGNALKFTPADGNIKIEMKREKNLIKTAISDTGPGIPKESMGDLFKKFSKIEYSYAKHSNQPGTGLGLYISKQIISLHNGDIQVESEVNVGTTFTVILPAKSKGEEAES